MTTDQTVKDTVAAARQMHSYEGVPIGLAVYRLLPEHIKVRVAHIQTLTDEKSVVGSLRANGMR